MMMRLVLILALALPAHGQILRAIVGGQAAAAAPSYSVTKVASAADAVLEVNFSTTTTGIIASGHTLVVFILGPGSAARSCTATAGGTSMADDYSAVDTGNSNSGALRAWKHLYLASGLASGSTIAVSCTVNQKSVILGYDVAGVITSNTSFDQQAHNGSFGTSLTTTATAALAQASEIVLADFTDNGDMSALTPTATGGATKLDVVASNGSVTTAMTTWKLVAATTAVTMTGTVTSNISYDADSVTYKAQ